MLIQSKRYRKLAERRRGGDEFSDCEDTVMKSLLSVVSPTRKSCRKLIFREL